MKNRRNWYLPALLVAVYVLFIISLVWAEKEAPDATITSLPIAVWYSLTTLTTIGYGDTFPVTAAGRIIASGLMVCSVSAFAALIGSLTKAFTSDFRARIRLLLPYKGKLYIFTERNHCAETLAAGIQREQKDGLILFLSSPANQTTLYSPGIDISTPLQKLVSIGVKKHEVCVFFMSEDGFKNYTEAVEFDKLKTENKWKQSCRIYCNTDFESESFITFSPSKCCAHLYWREYPVINPNETIVMIGTGAYIDKLIEVALVNNVIDVNQHLTYYIFGNHNDFRVNHPYLSNAFPNDGSGDKLIFSESRWEENIGILTGANRIIFCEDNEKLGFTELDRLQRLCPQECELYVMSSLSLQSKAHTFGSLDSLYTPELIMQDELYKTAMKLHEKYRRKNGGEGWNALSKFKRDSNLASADHLLVKASLLLHEAVTEYDGEVMTRAWKRYKETRNEKIAEYRKLEHIRWSRFHIVNNWRYAPKRDNGKWEHNLLVPFEELSAEAQQNNDYSWEALDFSEAM